MRKICYVVISILLVILLRQLSLDVHFVHASDIYSAGPSGGRGGMNFKDRPPQGKSRVVEIIIRAGTFIDSVQFIHENDRGRKIPLGKHGGDGGELYRLKLENGEYVTRISGRYGRFIDSIRIHTNFRTYPRYGGAGGSGAYSLKSPKDAEIVGIFGREGVFIDAIGILCRKR